MEFLKIVRRRSFLSEVVYTVLNIALAVAVVIIIQATQSPWLAIVLVIISKWRVLAVRPRYWFVNVQANLVDFMVSLSLIVFLYMTEVGAADDSQKLFILTALTILYIGWLLFLKPRSKRKYVVAQAGVALFVSTAALFILSYSWPASAVVLIMWLIGYSTARHILSSYDETHILFLSLLWGLLLSEIGWLAYHWTVAYSPLGIANVIFPRVALTVFCIGFVLHRAYDSFYHHQKIRGNDVILPILFTISIIVILPIVLNVLGANVTIGI
ncbi:hypothetical protein EPN95_01565 [Patescibacteria group bacterium]|nr:MAG: hypothetical protein EPN95_01565 [Patescibacteria group bacterium]